MNNKIVKEDKLVLAKLAMTDSLFVKNDALKLPSSVTVRSFAPMYKLDKFPTGVTAVGRLVKFFPCGKFKSEKGKPAREGTGFEIKPDGAPIGIALPLCATLRQGLAVSGEGENATSEALGCIVWIEKFEEKLPSKQGQDAWNFKVAYDLTSKEVPAKK